MIDSLGPSELDWTIFAYLSFRLATNIAKDTKEGGTLMKKKKYGRSCELF